MIRTARRNTKAEGVIVPIRAVNGIDPSRVTRSVSVKCSDLGSPPGFQNETEVTLEVTETQPCGKDGGFFDLSLRFDYWGGLPKCEHRTEILDDLDARQLEPMALAIIEAVKLAKAKGILTL